MIIIVMMIRMVMMEAVLTVAGRDCIVLAPCLVLCSVCVANIGVGAFLLVL